MDNNNIVNYNENPNEYIHKLADRLGESTEEVY